MDKGWHTHKEKSVVNEKKSIGKRVEKAVSKAAVTVDKGVVKIAAAKGNVAETARDISKSAKKAVDLTPEIAKRAYELYEQRGRLEGRAGHDWSQAEREIRQDAQ